MIQIPATRNSSQRRKKIWEIPVSYHCSVIGVCLSGADMRELQKKLGNALKIAASPYHMHALLVELAGTSTEAGKLLNTYLEKKYKTAVQRYMSLTDDAALEAQWSNDIFRGAMRGPYWALMTHPHASDDFLTTVYGQLHMLGYESLYLTVRHRVELRELREKTALLNQKLRCIRREGAGRESQLRQEVARLREQATESMAIVSANDVPADWPREQEEMRERLAEAGRREAELEKRARTLSERVQEQDGLLELADMTICDLEKKVNAGGGGWTDSGTRHPLPQPEQLCAVACGDCDEQKCGRCPGPALCGRTILYVGGQHKMIPLYRELIEKRGGIFLYHDGGTETSRQRLPQMISQADAVFCPVDCISHLACTCVKKLCKRQKKPFVMMRNAGLTHLAGSLEKISDPGRLLPSCDTLAHTHV